MADKMHEVDDEKLEDERKRLGFAPWREILMNTSTGFTKIDESNARATRSW